MFMPKDEIKSCFRLQSHGEGRSESSLLSMAVGSREGSLASLVPIFSQVKTGI